MIYTVHTKALKKMARMYPDEPVILAPRLSLNYSRFFNLAAALADLIQHETCGRRQNVSVLLPNSPELNLALAAVWAAGCTAAPLNPEMTDEQVGAVLRHARATLILGDQDVHARLEKIREYQKLKSLRALDLQAEIRKLKPSAGKVSINGEIAGKATLSSDPAAIFYTSGTTGAPKGVVLTHENLMANAEGLQRCIRLNRDDRVLQFLPLFHSFGVVASFLAPLFNRAQIVGTWTESGPGGLLELVERLQVTVIIGVSGLFHLLCREAERRKSGAQTRLRYCACGGGPMPRSLKQRFERCFGLRLDASYGLTEASPIVTLTHDKQYQNHSVGAPLPDCAIEIRNNRGKPLMAEEVGEVFVQGPNVMPGYYKDSRATRRVLTADGWLKTRDMGWLDRDGFLYICGRKRDLICVNGQNVFPQDVEMVLTEYPGFSAAAVIGVENNRTGEEVHAFLESRSASQPDLKQVRKFCASRLAPYQIPRKFHVLKSLPRTSMGKIRKYELQNALKKRDEKKTKS